MLEAVSVQSYIVPVVMINLCPQKTREIEHSAIVFVTTKLTTLAENIMTTEMEQIVLEKCKKVSIVCL